MKSKKINKARIKTLAGFSLLELLVVLFLLSLGYATLYSAGIGDSDQSDSFETTKSEVRASIRYAKRLALAKGQPVAVSILADEIRLFDSTGTNAIPSPTTKKAYVVSSSFSLSSFVVDETTLMLADGNSVSQIYFDEHGRLSSKVTAGDAFSPLKDSVSITISDAGGAAEKIVTINNITGELM